jgi:hypothetical protein
MDRTSNYFNFCVSKIKTIKYQKKSSEQGSDSIPYGFIGKFDYKNVVIKKHTYDSLLMRMGWNKSESDYKLKTIDFYQFNRYSPIIEKYPYLINKFNQNPKSRYYVNEKHNIVLVEVTDRNDKKSNVLVTCLFLDNYMISRYSKCY